MPQADYLLNELLGELATPEPAQEIVVGTCQDEFDHDYVENDDVNDYKLNRPTTTSTATTGSLPMVGLVRLLFRPTCFTNIRCKYNKFQVYGICISAVLTKTWLRKA